ncbi:hypothetical protein [Wenyingzhuangia sp. IMCC45574]
MEKDTKTTRGQKENKNITTIEQVHEILMNEIRKNYKIIKDFESKNAFNNK